MVEYILHANNIVDIIYSNCRDQVITPRSTERIHYTDNKESKIIDYIADGSEESFLYALENLDVDDLQIESKLYTTKTIKLVMDYLRNELPFMVKPYSINFIGISVNIDERQFSEFLIKICIDFLDKCIFGIAYYLKLFSDFQSDKVIQFHSCRVVNICSHITKEIIFDKDISLFPLKTYAHRNRELLKILRMKRRGEDKLTLNIDNSYVIRISLTENKEELLNNNQEYLSKNTLRYQSVFKKSLACYWSIALSDNMVVNDFGSFMEIEKIPLQISPFIFSLNSRFNNRNRLLNKKIALRLFSIIVKYPDEYLEKMQIPFNRFISAINSSNPIDLAIDLRTSLETLLSVQGRNKSHNLAARISYLKPEFEYQLCKKLYSFLSDAIHEGKFKKKWDTEQMLNMGIYIFRKVSIHYLENELFMSEKQWKKIYTNPCLMNSQYTMKQDKKIRIHALQRDSYDEITYNEDIIIINDKEYDFEKLPKSAQENRNKIFEESNFITCYINVDFEHQFIFINNNMELFLGFEWDNLSICNLKVLIDYLNLSETERRAYNLRTLESTEYVL